MGKANDHISSRVYFRKWSNTTFAVFSSLGKEIIIGEITSILNEHKTVKSSLVNILNFQTGKKRSEDEAEQEEMPTNQLLSEAELSLAVLLVNNSDITGIYFLATNNNSLSIYQKALSGSFLILALFSNLKLQVNFIR